jgi:glutamine amidotransferase
LENEALTADLMADAMQSMINTLERIIKEQGIEESAYLNMVVTDGERMVGLRYTSHKTDEPLSLYYSEGSRYECIDGVCHMIPSEGENRSMMIVSEKLTEFGEDWRPIPTNTMIMFYKDFSVNFRKVVTN